MVDETGIELHGAKGYADGMRALADDMADGTIPDVKREAVAVARIASTLAPHLTGRLARSIDTAETPQGYEVTAGSPTVRYAGVIEYGLRRDQRTGRQRNIRAQPYLRPAIARRDQAARQAWERDLQAAFSRQEWRD